MANGGFKAFAANVAAGDGFGYNETQTQVSARTLTEDLALLAGSAYNEGDVVNSGYAKTLKIIRQRNAILNNGISQVGIASLGIPQATPSKGITELDDLANLMEELRNAMAANGETNISKWSQIYYPAASAAYGYEPKTTKTGEVLAERFKAHNWFLPTAGQLARLYYYYRLGAANEGNIFKKAIDDGKFTNFSASYHWSSTENSASNSWYLFFGSGHFGYGGICGKYDSLIVRALVAF